MYPNNRRGEKWHIGKEIPLALVFSILFQTGGVIWWAATLSGKIDTLSEKVVKLQEEKLVQDTIRRDVAVISQMVITNTRRLEYLESKVLK